MSAPPGRPIGSAAGTPPGSATPAPIEPATTIVRSPAVEAAIGDGLLVVDPARVRAHGLNRSAAAVWRATATAATAAAVIEHVASTVALPAPSVATDVHRALAQLASEGLVQIGGQELPPALHPHERPGAFANVPATDEPVPAAFDAQEWQPTIGPFRGLDVVFDLTTTDRRLARVLAEVWAPLAIGDHAEAPVVRRYQLGADPAAPGRGGDARLLALDGHVIARPRRAADALALAVWHANQLVSSGTSRFLQLHAAGVVVDGVAVVLPASMNAGKSTLATGLVRAGAGYLTDETVAIDPGRDRVLPYPKAVSLDPGSWPLFPAFEPAWVRDDPDLGHHKWYVDPDLIRRGAAAPVAIRDGEPVADVPIGAIVFPRYEPGGATALEPLALLDAAAALAANAFNLVELGQAGVDELAHLATTTPCATLSVADLDAGVAAVLDAPRRG